MLSDVCPLRLNPAGQLEQQLVEPKEDRIRLPVEQQDPQTLRPVWLYLDPSHDAQQDVTPSTVVTLLPVEQQDPQMLVSDWL